MVYCLPSIDQCLVEIFVGILAQLYPEKVGAKEVVMLEDWGLVRGGGGGGGWKILRFLEKAYPEVACVHISDREGHKD